ncbi:hypothetical protein M8J75_011034 [Diaphorina citri]|nr:hypothetical protein M8J75_011034 [Diaphorina citri]
MESSSPEENTPITSTGVSSLLKLSSDDKLVGISTEENIESFKWKLDNKYYTADIQLSVLKHKTITSPDFSNSVEAVILYVDTSKESCLADVESWLPYTKDYNSSIEMLVCKNCPDSPDAKPSRNEVVKWCLDNEFELVELEPLDLDETGGGDEYEDDIRDVYGVERIAQALHAHVWPNLVRKDRTEPTSFDALKSGGAVHEEILAASAGATMGGSLELEDKINALLSGVEPPPDLEFGDLFQELAGMKERMSGMSTDRRRKTAEQIVMAFWKGIGGDEDELDLSEEEDK